MSKILHFREQEKLRTAVLETQTLRLLQDMAERQVKGHPLTKDQTQLVVALAEELITTEGVALEVDDPSNPMPKSPSKKQIRMDAKTIQRELEEMEASWSLSRSERDALRAKDPFFCVLVLDKFMKWPDNAEVAKKDYLWLLALQEGLQLSGEITSRMCQKAQEGQIVGTQVPVVQSMDRHPAQEKEIPVSVSLVGVRKRTI